jgi:hypothetical protein
MYYGIFLSWIIAYLVVGGSYMLGKALGGGHSQYKGLV